jgi:hypothetical protein
MAPRLRRLLTWTVVGAALARVSVLGVERGPQLVARQTLRVTGLALAAWGLHLVVHELAHWVAARREHFEVLAVRLGPLKLELAEGPRLQWAGLDLGGGVSSLPRGLTGLPGRLRRVAAAGPLATATLALLSLGLYLRLGQPGLGSAAGIGVVMGGFVLVTALLPGVLLPQARESGTDLDQLLQPRRILAHWSHAAVLQGLLHGQPVSAVASPAQLAPLLPLDGVEPLVLAWVIASCEAGDFEGARGRLDAGLEALEVGPQWLRTDWFNQRGAVAALVEADPARARACLARVREFAALPFYGLLLEGCIACVDGRLPEARAALEQWEAAVDAHPRGQFARAGNQWIVSRLTAALTPPE